MEPLRVVRQATEHWGHAVLAHRSSALFHFVVSQIIQETNCARFDSRKNITQSSCAARRRRFRMSAKRRSTASTSSARRNQRSRHLQFFQHHRSIELEEKRGVVFLVRRALVEQAPQLIYEFSPCGKITLQLADLVLRSGNLFRRFLVKHCCNDVELGLDSFVSCGGTGSESCTTAARLLCNSSVNDISEFLRRPDDSHNCDLFLLKLIGCDRFKVGEQLGVKPLRLLLSVIPAV